MEAMTREPVTQVPTQISEEAWKAADTIDAALSNFLRQFGFYRRNRRSRTTEVLAQTVQLAINRSYEQKAIAEVSH